MVTSHTLQSGDSISQSIELGHIRLSRTELSFHLQMFHSSRQGDSSSRCCCCCNCASRWYRRWRWGSSSSTSASRKGIRRASASHSWESLWLCGIVPIITAVVISISIISTRGSGWCRHSHVLRRNSSSGPLEMR